MTRAVGRALGRRKSKLLRPDSEPDAGLGRNRLHGRRLDDGAAVEHGADATARSRSLAHHAAAEIGFADEAGDEARLRSLVEIVRRADLQQPAMVEHRDTVGHGEGLGLVMRDEHDRDPDLALQMFCLDLHLLAQVLVERRKRLVHQQHARPVDDGARDRDALLLAARQLRRLAVAELVQPDRAKGRARLLLALCAGDAAHLQRKGDVLQHRHVRKQRVALEDHAEIALVRRHPGDVVATHKNVACVRIFEACDGHQDRGLAGAGGAEKRQEFAGLDLQRDPVDRGHGAEALDDRPQVDADGATRRLNRLQHETHFLAK